MLVDVAGAVVLVDVVESVDVLDDVSVADGVGLVDVAAPTLSPWSPPLHAANTRAQHRASAALQSSGRPFAKPDTLPPVAR